MNNEWFVKQSTISVIRMILDKYKWYVPVNLDKYSQIQLEAFRDHLIKRHNRRVKK